MEVLSNLFALLNKESFDYCVLRGYDKLPQEIENDIDFGILPDQQFKFSQSLIKFFKDAGYALVHKMSKYKYDQLYFYNITEGHIHIDVWSSFQIESKPYINIENLIASRQLIRGFYIPSAEYELALSFLKELLHNQKIRKDKIEGLRLLVNENFDEPFIPCFDKNQISLFKDWIANSKTELKPEHILASSRWKNPQNIFSIIQNKFSFYLTEFKLLFAKKGFLVVLVGPDGSGKTTTFNILKNHISKQFFSDTQYFHFNFRTIPSLSKLAGKKERKEIAPEDDDGSAKYTNEVEPSYLKKYIYVIYYFFDFFLGNFKMLKLRYRNKLVVFDRYYYDYFIHDGYTRIPRFLKHLYKWFSPKPDIFFYLKADAQKIYNRKPELSVKEIVSQQKKIEDLIINHRSIARNIYEIETDQGSEVVEKQINNYIFKTLRSRYE